MAIFSCVKPTAHDTLPRAPNNTHRRPLVPVNVSNGKHGAPPVSNSQAGKRRDALSPSSPLARSMSRRNGNGARLQKRGRISKTLISAPTNFEHVSHVNKDEALGPKEMAEVTDALRQSNTSPLLSTSETIIISNHTVAGKTGKEIPATAIDRVSHDNAEPRELLDGPQRKPTVNKRKAPPPVTPSIIKAAGLPPSLAPANTRNLPLSPLSSTSNVQALRSTPVKLKVKRQSTASPAAETERRVAHHAPSTDLPNKQDIDGLGGLSTSSAFDGLPVSPSKEGALQSSASGLEGPPRSATLQNLALSESMENIAKHGSDMSGAEKDLNINENDTLEPPKSITASPSGPLAYMTDSTKVRWNNGMAEIARQLKQQDSNHD